MPDAYDPFRGIDGMEIYRAAVAHAAAHMVYTREPVSAEQLSQAQMRFIELFEDARVEYLAYREFPGLRKLWLSFFTAEPGENDEFGDVHETMDLMLRATRAIMEKLKERSDWVGIDALLALLDELPAALGRALNELAEAEDGIDALLSQAMAYERNAVDSLTGFLVWLETDDLEIKRQMDSAGDRIEVRPGIRRFDGRHVVFEDGLSKKSDYRKFRVKGVSGVPDDFASMREVVGRRYRRLLEEGKELPDLVLVDGGRGQLGAAVEALLEDVAAEKAKGRVKLESAAEKSMPRP